MYKVIGTRKARTFRVLWILEELGLEYEHDPCSPRSDAARAANPSGKIPALWVDDTPIADSSAILTHLSDAHGKFTHPAGSLERAQQDALMFTVLAELDAVLWTAAQHSFVLPEERRVPAVKETLKWEFERNVARIGQSLNTPYLMGDVLMVPDIVLGHCLRWADNAGFPEVGPNLKAYVERVSARPAFQRVMEMP